ncbi:DNA polymerase zeta catalytic subunit, partial [Trichonephila inaurata madagascariensis]
MFSFRITKTEFSQHSPIKGYDVCYSDFRGCEIYKVPILSIYGTTPAGQKGCLHVHGVFPYMCLRWSDVFPEISEVNSRKYLQELALEIDKALNTDAGRSNSSRHHVHNIIIIKGKLIYGYHQSDEDFLKIYFYNPHDVFRTIDLLTKSKVLQKSIQPCYAHIPFRLQFYTDYNLGYGVIVNVSSYQFRAPKETCSALHADCTISSLLPDSNTSSHKVWNISTLTSSQVSDIPRETDQELELDCHEASILNKKDSLLCVGKNPGIAAIWDEERERRRLDQNSSQFTPPSTIERVVVESDSEIHFKNLFNKRCESDTLKQFEKNGEIGYIKDSQNSFNHLSSESFAFSNTQEKELLDMCISMYANQEPDDDSILSSKINFISDDDDEVTLEMSQQFAEEILSDIHPNSQSENQTSDHVKSLKERQHLIPQLDGAFDDEKFGTKQDNKRENSDNDKPPICHPVHPRGNHPNWNIQSSAKATNVKNSKAAEKIPILELTDNLESISDKMKKNVSKKPSLSNMYQDDKRQMKKLNASVTKCMESIIARVEKIQNEKSESHSFGSKECDTNNTSNLFVQSYPDPYESKTKSRKEECFIGARPKTTKNIPSISSKMSKSIQKKKNTPSQETPDLSVTPNLSSVSESPVIKLNLPDFARTVEQVNTTSNFKAHGCAISTNSSKHALKNKRTNLHPNTWKEDFLNVLCSTKMLGSSDSVPDKNIINPTNKKFVSSTSNNIKISSSNHRKPPLTINKFSGTEPLDLQKKDCFNIVTDLQNVNFSKVGHEVVMVKKLTEEEIKAATVGCNKISLKPDQTETLNSKSCNKTNHRKNVKNSHQNKGKSSDPYKSKNLKGQLPVMKSNNAQKINECVSPAKTAISNTNIKNSKCVAVNDNFPSPEKISLSKRNRSQFVNTKNSVYYDNSAIISLETNATYNLNQKVLESSSVKEGTCNNNKIKISNVPHFGADFNGSGEMMKNLEPKTLFSGTIINSYDSLINVKETHSDLKNSSDHHIFNQENITNSFISKPMNSAGSCSLSYSKNKGNMKDKNVSESRKKKLESAYRLNKKNLEQNAAEIHENFDVDSKKDIEETFKHSLQERNILYYPQPKTADVELLTKSHTKTFMNESNLLVDNIKVKSDSSVHQVDESAKLKQFYDNIVRNSPYVQLTDILKSGEGQTKHDHILRSGEGQTKSDLRKKHLSSKKTIPRPYRYPNVPIKSEQKESNILSEAKRNTSITYSKNSDIKVPKNVTKPKESQISPAFYNFSCKMHRASSDTVNSKETSTSAFEKNNPENTSPFSVKPKINSELEINSSNNAANEDCQSTGCSTKGPKPSIKSKYLDDMNAKNLLRNETKPQNTLPSHYDNNSCNKNLCINSAILESVSTVSARESINEDNSKSNLIFPLVSYNTLDKNKDRDKQKNCLEVLNDPEEGIINGSASKKNIKPKLKESSKLKDSEVPVIPKSNKNFSFKNPNPKVNNCKSDNSFLEKLKTEMSEPNLKHTKEVNNAAKNSKTSDENIRRSVHSHPSAMNTATVKHNSKSYCGDTGIEKTPEAKSVNVSNSESKLNSTEPWNNNDAPSYLYDIVKLRNASKQNSLNSNASKISNNNNSSIASKGKPLKKNALNNKSENAKSSCEKLNANSANKLQSAFEAEKLVSASKTKKYVPTSESGKTAAASIAKNCCSKSEYKFRSKNTLLKNSDHAYRKDHSEIKLCEEPIFDKMNQFTGISKSDTSSLIKEKIQSNPNSQSFLTSSKNHNDTSTNTLLHRVKHAKKSGNSNNFIFFTSKIQQRRCQNDTETSQIPKPTSSKLSLKLNKKGANVNAKRENTTLVDFKTKWKIDNSPCDNQSERSTSTKMGANQQVSEAVAFVPNIRIKKEPPDDYEVVSRDNNMKDALRCFDFDENSSSDPATFLSSSSKQSRYSKDQTEERDVLPRNGKNKYKKNSKYESAPLISKPNRSRKSVVEIIHSDIIKANNISFDSDTSTSQNNNTSSNNRYPKRNCPSSNVEDEVVILEDVPSSSAKSLKSKARSSRCLVSEVIDLEKEEDSIDRPPVITIKRDSDGNNSIIPNKKRCSDSAHNLNNSVNILESQTLSTSSSNNITDSCSKNLDDSLDSKHSLKLKLRVKTILTRSNEPKFVVIDRQLQGLNNDEINLPDVIHIKKEPGTESPKRKHSKIRQNYQQTSTRSNLYEPIVPPILIKDIKKEKDDDYEKKPYVAPLKVNLSTLNVTEVERPNVNAEPKLEPLRLCRKSNKFYVGTGNSANNELPENKVENPNNRNSTPPKRKRGRPAKVQNSSSPQKDISPLKNNTSFNGNSNAGYLTIQIPKKPASEQSFDIDKKCSFKQSCKKGQSDTDKNSAAEWWWQVAIKEEPKSDTEDPCSSNAASCSQKKEIMTISKRRHSLRCESFKKFFDSDHSDDDDKKPKTNEVKPQKKRKRSKSVNCESNKKILIETNEISSAFNRRTSARKGSFKKYFDSDKGENSDDDCKVVCVKKVEKPRKPGRRKKKRQYTTKNKQSTTSDKLTLPCNPCSVTLERLSPSFLEQNVIAKTTQNEFQPGRQKSMECTTSQNNDIKKIPESNSVIPESQHIAQMNHPETVSSAPGEIEHSSIEQFSSNVEKSSFKAMDEKVAHAFSTSAENTGTKFILDSGPVTINGLNSINMDNSLSEYLCDELISENKISPFVYNSPPLSTDSNIISNSNSSNFLRHTSREMDQCLFESPSSILKNGSMDSPLLYSQSPVMDVKQGSDLSPDSGYLHLSPQPLKQQTNLMHSSIFNSETIFEDPPTENFEMSSNSIRERLRTTDRDFNKGRQQRVMNTYVSGNESHNESQRSISSMISNSVDKSNVHVNISKDMHNPLQLHSKDFDRGHQHNSSYTLRNSPMDQNTEFLTYSAKGIVNYDKTSSEPQNSSKTPDSSLKRRKNDISCFSSAYSELRRPSKQVRPEESNTEKDHSCFSNSYNASTEIRQSPTSYSTLNQNGYNNAVCSMIHSRSEKPLNTLKNHNDYFARMKWDNPHHSSKNNGSFSEDNKPQMNHFPVQQNRYVGYYPKPNDSDPNTNSQTSNDPYYRSNWPDVNTHFSHNDRSLYRFSPNDGSFNDFSLNERSTIEAFRKSPIQQEFKKYDGTFCKISNQMPRSLSASNEEFHAPKSTDANFSHFSDYDCNPSKPKKSQPSNDK